MANKVLGIEIGQNLTRVVEIDYKAKKPKIYNIFNFPTPQDMMRDGAIENPGMFRSTLLGRLKEKHISTNKVIFVLNSARIASREVEIPLVKEKQIQSMIAMNASDYFPVDLSQYKLVHEIIDKVDTPEEKKLRLSVLAVPNDLILSYQQLAAACKLQIVGLDYTGNAIKQLMSREIPGEVKATVKIDETTTILTIMDGENVKLQRVLNYGLSDAIEEIMDSEVFGEYLSFTDAMDVARRKTCLSISGDTGPSNPTPNMAPGMQPGMAPGQPEMAPGQPGMQAYGQPAPQQPVERDVNGREVDSEKLRRLRGDVTSSLYSLISGLSRVIDYYQSRNLERPIERIFLIGLGADFSGLSKLLTSELNFKVVAIQQFDGIVLGKNVNQAEAKIAEYFTCIGSSLSPLPILGNEKKVVPMAKSPDPSNQRVRRGQNGEPVEVVEDEGEHESYGIPLLVFGGCVLIAVGLVAYGIFSNLMLSSDNMTLKTQVDDLAYAQDVYDTYVQTQADYEWTKLVDNKASNKNDELVSFIEELEAKMPSEINVINFSATTEGVVLNVSVGSKEAVADVVAQLRTFDSIVVTSISAIVEETDETGATSVEFSVGCTYVPSIEDDTENAEDSANTEKTQTEEVQ